VTAVLRLLFVIPAGYIAACLAAALVLVAASAGFGPDGMQAPHYAGLRVIEVIALAGIVGGFAAVPALIAIAIAEIFRLRSVFFHLVAGALAGVAAGVAVAESWGWSQAEPKLLLAAGLCGGLAYWLVAGRSSGLATPQPQSHL
jgi:hypothetical protein